MSIEIDHDANEVRETRTLRKSGDSTVLSLPPEVLSTADLTEGDDVTVAVEIGSTDIELRQPEGEE